MPVRQSLGSLVLAAGLVLLGSNTAAASSVTCGFGSTESSCDGFSTFRIFDFGPYQLSLDFGAFGGGVIGGFEVTIIDIPRDQSSVGGRLPVNFVCLPIAGLGPGQNCVEFELQAPLPVQGVNFTGDYRIDIVWLALTDGAFPDAPGGRVRLMHDSSLVQGNGFADITIPGSYFSELCTIECVPDPGIGGRDSNFQSFIVAQAQVPEPATLTLIGTGLAGAIAVRRRRRSRQDPRA